MPEPPVPVLSQSADYFFKDGTLTLQAENMLYRVHTYLFERHSKTVVQHLPGQSLDAKVLVLDGVQSEDFDQLLSVLYPVEFQSYAPKTAKQWRAVLILATTYEFTSIRQLAISQLSTLIGPAEKVELGHKYDIGEWLRPAYTQLCQRSDPISQEEGEYLEKADIIRIVGVRHRLATEPLVNLNFIIGEAFDLCSNEDDDSTSICASLCSSPGARPPSVISEPMSMPSSPRPVLDMPVELDNPTAVCNKKMVKKGSKKIIRRV